MRAITVVPRQAGTARLDDVPEPDPSQGAVLVDGLALGICGTDGEIIRGEYAWAPEGEERQADELVRHYKTLLSHPSVQAMTYWGFVDGGWLGAPGGFVRTDGTPKPAYEAARSLIKGEWWLPPTTVRTDDGDIDPVVSWDELSRGDDPTSAR